MFQPYYDEKGNFLVPPGILNLFCFFMAILLWKILKQSHTDEREIISTRTQERINHARTANKRRTIRKVVLEDNKRTRMNINSKVTKILQINAEINEMKI